MCTRSLGRRLRCLACAAPCYSVGATRWVAVPGGTLMIGGPDDFSSGGLYDDSGELYVEHGSHAGRWFTLRVSPSFRIAHLSAQYLLPNENAVANKHSMVHPRNTCQVVSVPAGAMAKASIAANAACALPAGSS